MDKVFLSVGMVENIVDTRKGTVNSDMILNLPNDKKYKLTVAIRLLKDTSQNNDLSEMILLPEDLKKRNYKLYSALTFSEKDNILRDKGLFEDEVEADGRNYKIEVGYIGVKLPVKENNDSKLVDLISVFKKEHLEIENHIKQLRNSVNNNKISYHEIDMQLEQLFKIFTAHTEKEDLFLYPKKFKDQKLAKIHEFTTDEIRMAYKNFSKYYNKWFKKINPDNFKQFQNESNTIVSDMLVRIKIEETEIFSFCS